MFLLNFCGLALFFNKHRKMFYNEEKKNLQHKIGLNQFGPRENINISH